MTRSRRRIPHIRALLTMLFLVGSMLSAPVMANQPAATPVVDPTPVSEADPPASEIVPVESDRQVLSDDPSEVPLPPDEGPPVERVPETGAAPSIGEPGSMAVIDPLTTMYLTIAETTGRTVVFPDGQTACFSILLDPPAAHGSPYTIHCITGIDGVAEVFAGMPDVHMTAYSIVTYSNTTACDFRAGEPAVTELGSGLSQVDIEIDADCPEDPDTPPGPLDGFGITLSDSTGLDRSYPGPLCMDVVATPPLPVPLTHPICLDASYGVGITNPAGVVFPRDTTYDLVVASNETGCTPSWSVFREEFVPPGVLVVGLIDVVLICEDEPAPVTIFDGVAFSLRDSSGTDRTYPGEICLAIQITPAVTVPGMDTLCYSASAAAFGWDAAGAILPRTSSYEGVVVSNTTGCTPSWSFREVLSADGPLIAVVDFVLTCDPLISESYAGIGVTLTDATGVDRTYDGEICIDVSITPAVTIPGAVPQCYTASYAQSGYPAAGAVLPRDSTYDGVIVSNTTGCEATWTTREMAITPTVPVEGDPILVDVRDVLPADPPPSSSSGGVMLVVDVVITCDDTPDEEPEYLAQVGIAFSDEREGDHTYPGEVCVDVRIDPIAGASTTQRYCTGATFMYRLFPGDFFTYLASSTYTTSLVSNATGCAAAIDPFQVHSYFGTPIGHIQVRIDCDNPGEEPEPSATATATSTATPGVTPSATATATATPVASETPVSSGTSEPSSPPAVSTHSVPKDTLAVSGGEQPATTGTTRVVELPNTGANKGGTSELSSALMILTGLSLLALVAGGIVRRKDAGYR